MIIFTESIRWPFVCQMSIFPLNHQATYKRQDLQFTTIHAPLILPDSLNVQIEFLS